MNIEHGFNRFSRRVSQAAGSPLAFVAAFGCIAAWAATGPFFHYSETWQLVINTGTTVVTFLMVFLIQSSQNRDSEALQLKLNEVIMALSRADNAMIDIEQLDQHALDVLRHRYERILVKAEKRAGGSKAKAAARSPKPSRRGH